MFIDSHCHLDFPDLAKDLDELLVNMQENQVTHALCVSVNLPHFPRVRALAEAHENLFASVGVHPDYEDEVEPTAAELADLAKHPKVIAIGETGLDYFRLQGDLEWQRNRFRTHIRAARACGLPLVIHTRSASDDTLAILREEGEDGAGNRCGGVFHCFTESGEVARAALDLGYYISFSGIITFKSAQALRDVVALVPMDRMLIETDSPYLAPVPFRGKTNSPAYVPHVAHQVAQVRGLAVEAVAEATSRNFEQLFLQGAPA